MDDTDEATLSLWDTTSTTPNDWQPSHTTLLISSPSLNVSHKNWLALASDTFVDVDPCIPEAERLRGFAGRKIKREHINPTFPYEGTSVCIHIQRRTSRCCRICLVEHHQTE